jgi:hypothetical protein
MRRAAFVFLAALVLLGAAPKKNVPLRDVSGLEWLEMSVGERTDQIVASMLKLAQEGIPLANPPDEYYRAVHFAVRRDPSYNRVPVTTILALEAYENEPEARPAIDALRARRAAAAAAAKAR